MLILNIIKIHKTWNKKMSYLLNFLLVVISNPFM